MLISKSFTNRTISISLVLRMQPGGHEVDDKLKFPFQAGHVTFKKEDRNRNHMILGCFPGTCEGPFTMDPYFHTSCIDSP